MLKFLFIIIIFIEIYLVNCYIVLPITILPEQYYLSKNETNNYSKQMSREFFTPLITSFEIGTPKQSISLLIKPKKNYLILNSLNTLASPKINYTVKNIYDFKNFSKFYNEKNSTTYNLSSTLKCTTLTASNNINKPIAEQICPSIETLYFCEDLNDTKKTSIKNNIDFYLTRNTLDNITGVIGLNLNLPDENKQTPKSFLSILNESKIINNYNWYFDFDNWDNKSGNLIIGALPHEIKNNSFNKKNWNLYLKKNENISMNYYEMKFDQIYFIDKTNNKEYNFTADKAIEFNFESNLIVGTNEFKNYFESILIDLKNQNVTCNLSNFFGYEDELSSKSYLYEFYFCEAKNNTMEKLKKKISSLYLYSAEMNYTFEITKDEILKTVDDTIYINIIFNANITKWILGKQFIFNNKLVFDSLDGTIGFYKKEKKKNKNNDKIYKLLIIIPLIIYLCAGPIIIVAKLLRKNDKDKKEEKNTDDEENNLKQNIIN